MPTTPAASPSRPSTKLIAFTVTSTSSTVNGTPTSAPSEIVPRPGTSTNSSCSPSSTITPAAPTCPASLVNASSPHLSSATPSRQLTTPAASPSRPSTKLIAFTVSSTSNPVHGTPTSAPSYIVPRPGTSTNSSCS